MIAAAESKQPPSARTPTVEDRITARTAYVQGKGSARKIALSLGLSPDTVRNWAFAEDWAGLREEYDQRQLRKLMGPEPPAPAPSAPPATGEQNRAQAERVSKQLLKLEEQMEGMTNTASLRDITAAHSRLFEVWCTLTGTQKPGTRKASRGARRTPQEGPTEPQTTPPVVVPADLANPPENGNPLVPDSQPPVI